jgi:hypothetical protein
MTSVLLTCPYCNAQFAYTPPGQDATRVTCPRCDDTFPWHPPAADVDERISAEPLPRVVMPDPTLLAARPAPRLPTRWIVQLAGLSILLGMVSLVLSVALPESNVTQRALPFMLLLAGIGLVATLWLWFLQTPRSNAVLAGFVLANMAGVALLVLPFALSTTAFRRSNDPRNPPEQPPSPSADRNRRAVDVPAVAPAQLAGLGYLPDNCKVVAGLHVAELYQQPIGATLFARHEAGADRAEPTPWMIEQGLSRVEVWAGLKPEAIDHVVFGLRVEGLFPHLTLVVRTRQPYDPLAVKAAQDALAAAQGTKVVPIKRLDRTLYQFNTKPAGYGMLWLADAQTVVLVWRLDALTERDVLALSEKQRQGAEGPPQVLRTLLEGKLSKGTLIWWCAVDIEQPQLAASMVPGASRDPELFKLLKTVRSLTGGLRLQGQDAAILANFECADVAGAQRLATLLERQQVPGLGQPKVLGPAPDGSDTWVLVQIRGTPEAVVRALRSVQLLPDLGKK